MKRFVAKLILWIICILVLIHVIWHICVYLRGPIQKRRDFNKATSIMIYDVNPRVVRNRDHLEETRHEQIDLDFFREMILKAKYHVPWSFLDSPMWKGGSLAIVEFSDGSNLQLAFSYHCFIKVVGESGYYAFDNSDDSQRWYNEYNIRIIKDKFIPGRKKGNRNDN